MAENSSRKERLSSILESDLVDDENLLTSTELEALRLEAKAKVSEDRKKERRQQVLKDMIREEKGRIDPSETRVEHVIDLPPHAPHIMINRNFYMHSLKYSFTMKELACVLEIEQGAWRHERDIGRANMNSYRPPTEKAGGAKYTLSAGFVRG